MTEPRDFWKRKLAAWVHDPAEKALVLMRDVDNKGQRIGHEHGSVAALRAALDIRKTDFDPRADQFAAAADRPQWPYAEGRSRPAWANVHFVKQPVLIHPLSGEELHLGTLGEVDAAHIRSASMAHFLTLIERDAAGVPDYRRTHLGFWRFGPEPALVAPELGALWRLLPADTRVPDHSIWQHLDVVSALSGAMSDSADDCTDDGTEDRTEDSANNSPALLTMSFGPVQGFIAQARSTSDLWAGSHLLSSLVWEGLRVVCEALGPDAVLFPNLRGVACVDRWLLEQAQAQSPDCGALWRARFAKIDAGWLGKSTDQNPLFSATLPNKFMAIVPARRARELAQAVTAAVRKAALGWATEAAAELFKTAGLPTDPTAHWHAQVDAQLQGFPEVHWSAAEWPINTSEPGMPVTDALERALTAFYPDGERGTFFSSDLWTLMSEAEVVEKTFNNRAGKATTLRRLMLDGEHQFFVPNPGLLYPAVHDLAERSLAAAKALRSFGALDQNGHRCTLTGEYEWLTHDPKLLALPRSERSAHSVWGRVAQAGKFGIKAGEHLGAIATLKRLWPTLFTAQVSGLLGGEHINRFVVSTHTMALATSLGQLAQRLEGGADASLQKGLAAFVLAADDVDRAVLPARLARTLYALKPDDAKVLRALPALLDGARDASEEEGAAMSRRIGDLTGHRPEAYYGLIQMDGDRMGAWMAGNEPDFQRKFSDTWHPQVRTAVAQKFGHEPSLLKYMNSLRPPSPARHAAISAVLNDFSTHVARHVVEEVFKGKLLYAGGDDVLAMVSVDDLLACMLLLRAAYSGVGEWGALPGVDGAPDLRGMTIGRGYVKLGRGRNTRLLPMMGRDATASIGAVVAHHQAPLGNVLRELRRAEKLAKGHQNGGRNAFCLRVMKRGGGAVSVTSRFWDQAQLTAAKVEQKLALEGTALGLLLRFADSIARADTSRRAVYNATDWLTKLPARDGVGPDGKLLLAEPDWQRMVALNLAMQFGKQGAAPEHASEFVALACAENEPADTLTALADMLVTAEFFAREGRSLGGDK